MQIGDKMYICNKKDHEKILIKRKRENGQNIRYLGWIENYCTKCKVFVK